MARPQITCLQISDAVGLPVQSTRSVSFSSISSSSFNKVGVSSGKLYLSWSDAPIIKHIA